MSHALCHTDSVAGIWREKGPRSAGRSGAHFDPLLSPMTVGNRAPHYQLQASGLISEHSSAGFQSGARLVMDLEESCSTKTNARRFEVPVPTSIIGGPSGTIPLSPA